MRIPRWLICTAALLAFGFSTSASAVPVEVEFSGIITQIDPTGFFYNTEGIRPGDGFTGTYTIDEDDIISSGPLAGGTRYTLSGYEGEATIFASGSGVTVPQTYLLEEKNISIFDNGGTFIAPFDWWLTLDTPGNTSFALQFVDQTRTKLSNEDFFVPDTLDGWTAGQLYWREAAGVEDMQATMLSLVVIPEPSTALLMALGLGGLAMRRSRRA